MRCTLPAWILLLFAVPLTAQTWTGANSSNWNDVLNWDTGIPVNGGAVIFSGTPVNNVTNNDLTGLSLTGITLSSTNAITIGGNDLTIGTGGIKHTATNVSHTINANIILAGNQTWQGVNNATSMLTVNGVISGTGNLTWTGAGNNGYLRLNAVNTFAGNVFVGNENAANGPTNGGRITLGISNALPATSLVTIGATTGTTELILNGFDLTIAGLVETGGGTRRISNGTLATQSILTINTPAGVVRNYGSQVGSNAGGTAEQRNMAIVKTGPGFQGFDNTAAAGVTAMSYTGSTTVSAGGMGFSNVASAAAPAWGPPNSYILLDGGVVMNINATNATYSRNLSATPAGTTFQWTANGGGFAARGGIFTVNISIADVAGATLDWGDTVGTNLVGPLKFGHADAANNELIFQNAINLNGAVRTIDVADNIGNVNDRSRITGVIADGSGSGSGGLLKTGNGFLSLEAVNTYTGTTTVAGGTLSTVAPTALPGYNVPGQVSVNTGATLQLRAGGAGEWTVADLNNITSTAVFQPGSLLGVEVLIPNVVDITGNFGGNLGLRKDGTGTLNLLGTANSYTGGTVIAQGVLGIVNDAAIGTGSITLSGGTLAATDTTPRTITNPVFITNQSTIGDSANNGAFTFTLPFDMTAGNNRTMVFLSDTLIPGFTNGLITNKDGSGKLTIQNAVININANNFTARGGETVLAGTTEMTVSVGSFRVQSQTADVTSTATVEAGAKIIFTVPGSNLRVGLDAAHVGNATFNLFGTLNMSLANAVSGNVNFDGNGQTNTFNLNAGGLVIGRGFGIANPVITVSTKIVNFNGGTFQSIGSNAVFIDPAVSQANILAGVTFDTNGFDITIDQPLLGVGSGGVAKTGLGTLTLGGANTYTGTTDINRGTVSLAATGIVAGPINVQGGDGSAGTLRGIGTANGLVTVNGGSGASPVPGTVRGGSSIGTLTLAGGLTVNAGGSIYVELAGTPNTSAANLGDSTDAVPNPTTNNYLNITGGTSTISNGATVIVDGTNAVLAPGNSYSFRIAGGAGPQAGLPIINPAQFTFLNIDADPSSVSLTGDAGGTLFLNFSVVIPEPAALLVLGLAGLAWRRRR